MKIKEFISEKWSAKYKRSINCSNPKGFSQRAHCQGRQKNEDVQLDELNVAQTLKFIKQAHGDQLYGKLPYWTHPRAVALTGKKIFGSKFNSDAVKVAFLHDVVEDTNISLKELSKLDFSSEVIEAVSLLTKDNALGYSQNIERIINSDNPLAMMVKYADNYENYTGDKSDWDPKRAASSQKKYLASLNTLGDKLGVKHHIGDDKKDKDVTEKLNRTTSDELVIFDIDDTLLHTTAKINVVKDGKVIKSLTNQEFNNYKLSDGEEFDFGEFRNARKFEDESVPIGPMLDKLKGDLSSGKNVVMLTARADFDDQPAVWRTFKRHGIDINKDVHLYRAGNLAGGDSPAAKKAVHVSKWLKTGNYNKVVMYDDSTKNLTVFKTLKKYFPDVDFEAHHVSEKGETRQVENFADGRVKGKSRPGRVKRAGASCSGSVSDLRSKAKSASGEKAKMYHWCANMKSGKKK